MASIWLHEAGAKEPRKVQGHLDPASVIALFKQRVAKVARKNPDAKLVAQSDMEALFQFDTGQWFSLFVEPASPPTAPEKGQPKIRSGRGILVTDGGVIVELAVPKGPPEPEAAE